MEKPSMNKYYKILAVAGGLISKVCEQLAEITDMKEEDISEAIRLSITEIYSPKELAEDAEHRTCGEICFGRACDVCIAQGVFRAIAKRRLPVDLHDCDGLYRIDPDEQQDITKPSSGFVDFLSERKKKAASRRKTSIEDFFATLEDKPKTKKCECGCEDSSDNIDLPHTDGTISRGDATAIASHLNDVTTGILNATKSLQKAVEVITALKVEG